MIKCVVIILLLLVISTRWVVGNDAVQLEAVTVDATRLPEESRAYPFSNVTVTDTQLRTAPQLRTDDILRNAVPGFGLFRRSSSRVTHPTAQGVSLRNLGPNGASRTLVLLDGIPLNDPFAGWVPWSRVPPSSLREVIVNSGGGAGLFGNAAEAGTIHLRSAEPVGNTARGDFTVGSNDTYEASLDTHLALGPVGVSTFVSGLTSGGYPIVQDNQRGPIDTNADAASWTWRSRLDWQMGEDTRFSVTGSAFAEDRTDGTLYTNNSTDGQDASVSFEQRFPSIDAALRVQGCTQLRRFESTFSGTDPARTVETPALDQYNAPATAAGGSVVWEQQLDTHRMTAGTDARWIEGETQEHFSYLRGEFTRNRRAGGQQLFLGAFMEDRWQITPAVELIAGGRLDYWQQYDGHRQESDLITGAMLQNSTLEEQSGVIPNGRIGISTALTRQVRTRVAGYTGFRVPTLNELYRPFRVGNDITEANADLVPERLFGSEFGVEWEPSAAVNFTFTGFYNQLHNAVGNVTIARGPGTFSPGGFVPAGGVLRQRRNLDEVEVFGLETGAEWKFAPDWRARLQYVYTHPTVVKASDSPDLEGKWLAQSPQHVGVGTLEWTPGRWTLLTQTRYQGQQFEDDLNTLPLAPYITVDASVSYTFNKHTSATVRIENLLDTESEVGKTAGGLVRIGAPRLVSLTLTLQY